MNWMAMCALGLRLAQPSQPTPAPVPAPPPAGPASSSVSGDAMLIAASYPRRHVSELRPRVSIDATARPNDHLELRFAAFAEGLAGDRAGATGAAIARVQEAWVQVAGARADLRAGFGRLVWGRLDEVQPSDVINPIDAARYFLNGREDARLPVALVRARLFVSENLTIEGVLSPFFRRARFDELDEPSSPFNLITGAVLPAGLALAGADVDRRTPATPGGRVSGGGRVSTTIGRVDASGSVYRGRDGFGIVTFEPDPAAVIGPLVVGHLVERFPRFTMVAGDAETIVGEWAIRGEAAWFTNRTFAAVGAPGTVPGRSLEAGGGVDRRVGAFRLFASAIVHREWSDAVAFATRTDVNVVGSVERAFSRDRWLVRVFGVANPGDRSGFLRGLVSWRASDRVTVETSAGTFLGTGDDAIARFSGRDFVFARVRYGR